MLIKDELILSYYRINLGKSLTIVDRLNRWVTHFYSGYISPEEEIEVRSNN